jgi:hypothetical protein
MVRGHRKNGDCSDVIITAKEEQGERACFRAVSGPAAMPKLGSVMRVKADVGGPLQIHEFIAWRGDAWCGDSTARPQSVRSQVCRAKATGPSLPGQDCLRARTGARAVIEEHPSRSCPHDPGALACERYPPHMTDCRRCTDSCFCLRESPSTLFGPIAIGPACISLF